VERHDREFFISPGIDDLSEREEAADQGPVGMDTASASGQKQAASVRFVAQNRGARLGASEVEVSSGQSETAGQAQRFIWTYRDGFVITASAADLALKRESALTG
jgi:hypothetical protein